MPRRIRRAQGLTKPSGRAAKWEGRNPPPASGWCDTRKLRWADESTALIALGRAQRKYPTLERVYRCPTCLGWHLTRIKDWRGPA